MRCCGSVCLNGRRKCMFLICLIFQYLWIHNIFGSSILRLSGLPTLEQATYNCPCEKQSVCKYKPHNSKDCPCALLIVIANANRIGNSNLLKWNDISVGIIGIRRMRTSSPLKGPVKIFASMMLVINFFTERCVPLQSLGFYWKMCAITKLGLFRNMIKYLLNNKINGISIMKKKFTNKFLE